MCGNQFFAEVDVLWTFKQEKFQREIIAQVSQLLEVCVYSHQEKKSELTLQAALKYALPIEWGKLEN